MKIAGKKIEGLNEEHIFIPRGSGEDIHFIARAVVDFTEFEGLCPQPKARKVRSANGQVSDRPNDSQHEQAMNKWASQRIGYIVVKSLEATPNLEFESVNINDPSTYENWQTELTEAGFSVGESTRVLNGVLAACGLDEDKVKAARDRFLTARQQDQLEQHFPVEEHSDTQSGELANASD